LTVSDIGLLIGQDVGDQIPHEFPALDDIGVRSVSLSVVPATRTLTGARIVIEFQPHKGQTWSVFDGMIVFDGMSVSFDWLASDNSVNVSVDARSTIAGGTLATGITLPATDFYCKLESGSIDIAEIVAKVSNNTISMKAVNCTVLNFSGSVTDKWYRFQATVTDDWKFTIPGSSRELAITQIAMD